MTDARTSQLAAALERPPHDPLVVRIAALIADIEAAQISLADADALLTSNADLRPARSLVSFQDAAITGNITVGDIARGHIFKVTINIPASPPPIDLTVMQACFAMLPTNTIPNITPLPPGSRMPLAHNHLFVGRESEFMILAALLKGDDIVTIGRIVAVTGLGGIGKTQLASEFAHRYGRYFAGGVFWLNFDNSETVPAQIIACGGPGGLNLLNFAALEPDNQIACVIQEWQGPIPRLLVFDGCEDQDLLTRWRPKSGGASVLVTSQRTHWPSLPRGQLLVVPTLRPTESMALLRKFRPDLPEGDPDLEAICVELGDLPLALHLAGSYLETFAGYSDIGTPAQLLAELRNSQLLDHDALRGIDVTWSPTNHELHVARTFAVSFKRLDAASEIDSTALQLLTYAACFAPGEPIPHPLLESIVCDDFDSHEGKKRVVRGLNQLKALGLITADNSMHRLLAAFVQKVSTDFVGAQSLVERRFLAMLQPGDEEVISPLAHLRFVTDNALKRQDELAADLAFELDNQLLLAGDYKGALNYGMQALAIRETLLPFDDLKRAQSLNSNAGLYHRLGRLEDSRRDYELALAILDGTNKNERLVANVHGNLGILLMELGELDTALPHLQQGLTLRRQVFGEEDKLTAGSYSDLATWHFYRDEFIQARVLYQESLDIFLRIPGPQDRDIARAGQNLAETYFALKEYPAARSLFEKVLNVREAQLPAEHPDIANTLHHLALCCYEQGEESLACRHMRRSFQIRDKMLGSEHPYTESSRAKLEEWKCPVFPEL